MIFGIILTMRVFYYFLVLLQFFLVNTTITKYAMDRLGSIAATTLHTIEKRDSNINLEAFHELVEGAEGLPCKEPLCSNVVVVAQYASPWFYRGLGLGTVITSKLILTLKIVANEDMEDLFVIEGQNNHVEKLKKVPVIGIHAPDETEIQFPHPFVLLEIEGTIQSNLNMGKAIYDFEPAGRKKRSSEKSSECELISVMFNHHNKVTKSIVLVQLESQNSGNCKITTKNLWCVKSTIPNKHTKGMVNPCREKTNLASPIFCDGNLKAVFYGSPNGKGCKSCPDLEDLTAYKIKKPDVFETTAETTTDVIADTTTSITFVTTPKPSISSIISSTKITAKPDMPSTSVSFRRGLVGRTLPEKDLGKKSCDPEPARNLKGLPCIGPLCSYVVLITKQKLPWSHHALGLGTILNPKWILTLELVVTKIMKGIAEDLVKQLVVFQGNYDYTTNLKQIPIAKIHMNNEAELFPKTFVLLEAKDIIQLDFGTGYSIYDFAHTTPMKKERFSHCELISVIFENNDKVIKTFIPLYLEPYGSKNCTSRDEDLWCVKSLLWYRNDTHPVNPCMEEANLAAPIFCDLGLEAVFYGSEDGGGCDSSCLNADYLKAYYIKTHYDANSKWMERVIRPHETKLVGAEENYENDSTTQPKPLPMQSFVLNNSIEILRLKKYETLKKSRLLPPPRARKCSFDMDCGCRHNQFLCILFLLILVNLLLK